MIPNCIKILLVEDDEAICEATCMFLESEGFQMSSVKSATEMFEQRFSIPDVFLIDRRLGDGDGLKVCAFLKEQPATMGVPVIILSATPGIAVLAKNAGADAALEKPFKVKELVSLILSLKPAMN